MKKSDLKRFYNMMKAIDKFIKKHGTKHERNLFMKQEKVYYCETNDFIWTEIPKDNTFISKAMNFEHYLIEKLNKEEFHDTKRLIKESKFIGYL